MAHNTADDAMPGLSVADAIENGGVHVVFQPIVDLLDEEAIGWEGLARIGDSEIGFDRWLETAVDLGLGSRLQHSALDAVAAQGRPPGDGILFVNVGTDLLLEDDFVSECDRLAPRLALDIRGADLDMLSGFDARLNELVAAGIFLSIDDTTAASMATIARVRPSFIKIDRSVVRDAVHDSTARSIVRAYVAFADSEEIHVVAEGVERLDQLELVSDLGVRFAQGYLFGMPSPSWTPPSARRPRPPAVFEDNREIHDQFRYATSLHAVAEIACTELRARGLLPSVYLERDGVLRCIAQQGYWQVVDGIPVKVGVMAKAFRTSRTQLVDPEDADDYIASAPGIKAELAVPLRVGGRVVGVLNVESLDTIEPDVVEEIGVMALAMAERLEHTGAELEQSALHRLARANIELSALEDVGQIESACTRLACEISGLSSAMLAMASGPDDRGFTVRALQGPLAAEMRSLPMALVNDLCASLDQVSSCLTSGDDDGEPDPAWLGLHQGGASSIAAFPVRSTELGRGLLVVADHAPVSLELEEREALEMLAREVGRSLDMAVVMADLRARATRDPLTGLGNLAAFQDALSAIGGRRRGRWAVAMADVDGFKRVNDTYGHLTGDRILRDLATSVDTVLRAEDRMYRIGGDEFAVILHDVDEDGAQEIGDRMAQAAASVMGEFGAGISVGIALPARYEPATDFLDRADKMLYEVKREARGSARVAPAPTDAAESSSD